MYPDEVRIIDVLRYRTEPVANEEISDNYP